ncbi:hypothetical protein NDU88_010490 [Pleurodeles waltl]|uniref:Uncharacterized protein n=1 Tax=Pleurodeles waltl TaxID=8319 RepID=A0AAV7QVV2_PLEWA|nr:hypothetical protein NDU88_010490 [Pleurodeles waltl]
MNRPPSGGSTSGALIKVPIKESNGRRHEGLAPRSAAAPRPIYRCVLVYRCCYETCCCTQAQPAYFMLVDLLGLLLLFQAYFCTLRPIPPLSGQLILFQAIADIARLPPL